MFKKIWADPVWSKGIYDLIKLGLIGVVCFLVPYLAGLWPFIIEWIISETKIPNWILLILCILAVMYPVKIGRAFICRCKSKEKEEEPALKSYTHDLIFDIFWRWTEVNGIFVNLKPYCPECDYELSSKNKLLGMGHDIRFSCDHCRREIAKFDISLDDISKLVYREIERKFRTGLWLTEQALPPNAFPTKKFTTIPQPRYGTQ
jgi:hypothetical protein